MALVNMAVPDNEVAEYTPNPYGYGLCLRLTEEQVELLGLDKNPPKAGSVVSIRAFANVTQVTSSYNPAEEAAEGEDPESIDVALELQITDLEITDTTDMQGQRATMLYGADTD
jgi:hypothetical protein